MANPNNPINTKFLLRIDSWTNWSNATVAGKGANLVLLKGEVGICEFASKEKDPVTGVPVKPAAVLFKVGDGTSKFSELKWVSGLAADVYDWAKCQYAELDGQVLKFHNGDKTNPIHTVDLSVFVTDAELTTILDNYQPAGNYKVVQTAVNESGSTTQTLTNLKQNANGEVEVTFEDIDFKTGTAGAIKGKEAIIVKQDSTDKKTEVSLKIAEGNNAGNVTLSQSANGLKAEVTLPTVNDGTLTLTSGEGIATAATSFSANDAGNRSFTVAHDIPAGASAGNHSGVTTDKFGHVTAVDLSNYATNATAQANTDAISAIKDHATVDSFADVMAEIAKKQDTIPANTYDPYGAAAAVLGDSKDATTANTVYGAKAAASAAQSTADDALDKIDTFLASVSPDGSADIIDTLQEINDYIGEHGQEFAALSGKVTNIENGTTVVPKASDADTLDGKDYTYFATAAQGSKADSAVQEIATGSVNGTISVDGADVAVKGLGSAAYTASTAYATAAQGTKADTAVQPGDLGTMAKETAGDYVKKSEATGFGDILTKTDAATLYATASALGVNTNLLNTVIGSDKDKSMRQVAQAEVNAAAGNYATAAQGSKADTAVQTVTSSATGIKATKTDTTVDIAWDSSVVMVFYGGTSTDVI